MTTLYELADEIRADGIYPGTSRAEYDAIEAVSQSRLKLFRRTPAHARWEMDNPSEASEAMAFGTAFHCAILQPWHFDDAYRVAPKFDRRTKIGKEAAAVWEAEHAGKLHIGSEDYETINLMQYAAEEHPTASSLLCPGSPAEVAAVWSDGRTGLRCKALLDKITIYDGWTCIVDLKSCEDASPGAFSKDCAKYTYHVQAAFYLDGLNALAPLDRRFLFIACEKKPPYAVAVYELDAPALERGRQLYQEWLAIYAECMKQNTWPGYASTVSTLSLPKWEFNQ